MCLRMLQRFTAMRFNASDEVLQILSSFKVSSDITIAADKASRAGPFLASAFACELALTEWGSVSEVVERCVTRTAPISLEMEGASVFFDPYPGKWGSQQVLRTSWCRLS